MTDRARIGRSNVKRSQQHELKIAKLLHEWSGQDFRRRRTTGRDHLTTAVDGVADVIPVDIDFKFTVECKCGQGFSLEALMAGSNTAFATWWAQAEQDARIMAETRGRLYWPLLFFKPTHATNWVAAPENAFAGSLPPNRITWTRPDGPAVVLSRWQDFANVVKPTTYFRRA